MVIVVSVYKFYTFTWFLDVMVALEERERERERERKKEKKGTVLCEMWSVVCCYVHSGLYSDV